MVRKSLDSERVLNTINIDRKPDIEVTYNPYYINVQQPSFDPQPDSESIVNLSSNNIQIDVIENRARPLSDWPQIVDIIINFTVLSLAAGFFGQMGIDVYTKLKSKIKQLAPVKKDARGNPIITGAHIIFRPEINGKMILIKVAIRITHIDKLGIDKLSIDNIISFVESSIVNLDVDEILIAYLESNDSLQLIYYRDSNGNYFQNRLTRCSN